MNQLFVKGKVALVGAGSGDPELLTVKAMRLLQQAEVVMVDRLVSPEIIKEYVNPAAEVVYVGKQCRKGLSTPQDTINELMVIYAKEGKRIVRLKGGDVSIFSNILDELNILAGNQIPYEIVPGISAALGAAAYAGIPLTARNHSTAVRLLTAYKSDVVSAGYWKELAQTDDTLVFYMSSETIMDVVDKLTANNISEDKLLAVIEQATTPFQKVYTSSLYEYRKLYSERKFISPSLIIIGKVVQLHQQFEWFTGADESAEYFNPIEESTINNNQKLALTA
jgi:uroporphyrin-III C-methyltransferase